MKATLIVIALAGVTTLGACGKKNDAQILQHEAASLAKYYAPKLDAIDQRIKAIMDRGAEKKPDGSPVIPGTFPGVREISERLQSARDTSAKLRGIVSPGPGDQKSAVEKQAEAAANESNLANLRRLVHDTEQMLDRGMTVILADLQAVESWLHHYDNKTLAIAPPAMAPPASGEQAGQPTGQPPAAAEQGSAAPVPPAPQPGAANKPNAPAPGGQIK
jgi:hypothetical protein